MPRTLKRGLSADAPAIKAIEASLPDGDKALRMALAGEQGAVRFFEHVAGTSPVAEVRSLAATYAAEEQEHVGHVLAALSRHLPPSDDWDEDLDPPVSVE